MTPSGTMFEQRDILLVPVPYTDLSASKQRPVLVLSSDSFNARSQDILVAAITSNTNSPAPGPVINSDDLEQGTMPLASRVRADKIYTLSQAIVRKRFGKLSRPTFEKYLAAMDEVLGRAE